MVFLFLNLGGGEIFTIVIVFLMLFGSKNIPEIARSLGKGMREIKNATGEIQKEINEGTRQIKEETKSINEKE